jgi:hypothetical protein
MSFTLRKASCKHIAMEQSGQHRGRPCGRPLSGKMKFLHG